MGSGYFPLDHKREGAELSAALDAVEKAARHDYEDSQTDNAAADGGSLAELNIAANLIWQNLDFFQSPGCEHEFRKHGRCRAYWHLPGGGVREARCDGCSRSELPARR